MITFDEKIISHFLFDGKMGKEISVWYYLIIAVLFTYFCPLQKMIVDFYHSYFPLWITVAWWRIKIKDVQNRVKLCISAALFLQLREGVSTTAFKKGYWVNACDLDIFCDYCIIHVCSFGPFFGYYISTEKEGFSLTCEYQMSEVFMRWRVLVEILALFQCFRVHVSVEMVLMMNVFQIRIEIVIFSKNSEFIWKYE